VAGFDRKAIIVFTDGLENTAPMIRDVMGSIDSRTFAIGLGTETQISTAALNALANGTGGYLLLTGLLGTRPDDTFLLTKYFLQILAGVTNTSVVLDPSGYIAPGTSLRIPFELNETDIDSTVILLSRTPVINIQVEAPDGASRIDPANAAGLGAEFAEGTGMQYYRFALPVALGAGAHAGTWHALLRVDERAFKRQLARLDNDPAGLSRARAHGAQFSLVVQSYSNLRMQARLDQTSLQPGATITLSAVLKEYGIPVDHRATVQAELLRPDNTTALLSLAEAEPGVFQVGVPATIAGIYRFRAMASGLTMRGTKFAREQLLTAAVFQAGDNPLPTGGGRDGKDSPPALPTAGMPGQAECARSILH